MKNFKKVVALVLTFALVLSMGTVAFAATDNAAEADVLYDLGLFKGYSDTTKELGLTDSTDAYQAITLIGRALGWEVDAAATVAFTDVPEYAVPYVAYAVKMGITNGVSATEFGSAVDGKRMVAWTLRALGYDMAKAWEDTDTLAAEAGIPVPTTTPTRDTVVGVIYDTLMTTPVGGTMTVIEKLVAADATLKMTAEKAGLIAAPSADFAIVSTETFGLKAVVITFASDIDGDVTVTSDDIDVTTVVEDGAVATVIFATTADQAEELELTVTATGKDGVEVDEEDVTVTMIDKVDPEVVSVVATNAKTIKVTYSEPVTDLTLGTKVFADVKIDDAKLVGEATISDDLTVVTYKLNTKLAANTYEFTTEDAKDFAGFTVAATTATITVVADDAAPQLVSVEATSITEVVLTFDEDVEAIGTITIDGDDYSGSAVDIDGTEVTVTISALEASDAFVAVSGEYDEVEDVLGNKSDEDMEFSFKAPFDEVAPTATVVVTEDNYLAVTFSEDVTGANLVAAYDLVDDEDDAVAFAVIEDERTSDDFDDDEDADDQIFLIAPVTTKRVVNSADYVLTVGADDIEDGSVLANKVAEKDFSVSLNDNKAPSISGVATIVDADDDIVRVSFDEEMDTETLEDVANFMYNNSPLALVDDVEFDVAADGKSVDITIEDVTVADTLKVLSVEDVAGNLLNDTDFNATLAIDAPSAFTVATATLVDNNTIEITANADFEVADPNEFTILENGVVSTTRYFTSAVVDEDDDDKIVLTLNDDILPDVTTDNAVVITIAVDGDDTVDVFGTSISDAAAVAVVDGASATVEVEEDKSDMIVLTLDEELSAASVTNVALDVIVRDEDGDAVTVAIAHTVVDGVSVFTLTGADVTVDEDTTFTVEVFARYLMDAAGNVINALEETEVTVED